MMTLTQLRQNIERFEAEAKAQGFDPERVLVAQIAYDTFTDVNDACFVMHKYGVEANISLTPWGDS